jgi:hypothetical protein
MRRTVRVNVVTGMARGSFKSDAGIVRSLRDRDTYHKLGNLLADNLADKQAERQRDELNYRPNRYQPLHQCLEHWGSLKFANGTGTLGHMKEVESTSVHSPRETP